MKKNNKSIQEQRNAMLKKVGTLRQAKSGINWQNRLRAMQIALTNKDKLINGDLLWAERAIERSKALKIKLVEFGKSDIATFNKVLAIYNEVKAKDFKELEKVAIERMTKDVLKCDTDEQRKVVTEYHQAKSLRELKLKGLIKEVLTAEGLIKKDKDKPKKIESLTEVVNPVEQAANSEVPVEVPTIIEPTV